MSAKFYLEGEPLGSRLDARGRRRPRSLAEIFPSARSRTVEFAEEERHGAGYCLF